MNKFTRKIMLIACTGLFLLITPFIVLYAIGYRTPQTEGPIPSVGVLTVESFPKRARIIFNNKDSGSTPEDITGIRPSRANIKVSKESYIPWAKNINIKPGQVTYLDNIRLFKREPVIKKISQGISHFSLSPDRKLLATAHNNTVEILDTDGQVVLKKSSPFLYSIKRILWSPESDHLLVFSGRNIYWIDLLNKNKDFNLLNIKIPKDIVWDPRIPNRVLIQTAANDLVAYHISSGATTVLAENITCFAPSAKSIFTAKDNTLSEISLLGRLLANYNLNQDKPVKQLLVTPNNNVALLFSSKILSVLTPDNQLLHVADNVQKAGWSPDGQVLYFKTDPTSIHIYNAFNERLPYLPVHQSRLVLRLSRPISNPQWFAGGHHIIYQTDDEIKITETDTRDHPITYLIDSTDLGNCQCDVGSEGRLIFYLKSNGQSKNLFVAEIAGKD